MEAKKTRKSIVKELENKNKEYIDHLQRLQAEFDNYRKHVEKEKVEFVKFASHKLIEKILPILDNLEIALKTSEREDDFFKGIAMIYNELKSILKKEGLEEIKSLNNKFNPMIHEVVLKQESQEEEGIVLEELQKGYMLNGRVLRFAKVKISGGKNEKNISS